MTEDNKSLAGQTAHLLIQYIVDNNLEKGQKLPNENFLCEMCNVGRSTLREAVRMLVSRHILETRQGAGVFICENTGVSDDPLGFTFIKDKYKLIMDLAEFRMLVEPRSAALAAVNATPEQINELAKMAEDIEHLYVSGQSYTRLDAAFHGKLGQMSGNVVLPSLEPIIMSAITYFNNMGRTLERDITITSHYQIVDAIRNHNPVAAEDAMYLHLVYTRNILSLEYSGE